MKTILLLTDFSKRAERAAYFALELALANKADLVIYNSVILLETANPDASWEEVQSELQNKEDRSWKMLSELTSRLHVKIAETDGSVKIIAHNGRGSVAETVPRLVREYNVWMLVMGNSLDNYIAGKASDGNVSTVLSRAGCTVALVP